MVGGESTRAPVVYDQSVCPSSASRARTQWASMSATKTLPAATVGALALVEPGPGAPYFAAVVILTMLAAQTFDPRLIWDKMEKSDG